MRRTSLFLVGIAGLTLVGQAFADDAGIRQFLLGQGHGGYSAPPAPAWPAMPPPMLAPPRAAPRSRKPVVHLRVKRPQAVAHVEMPEGSAST